MGVCACDKGQFDFPYGIAVDGPGFVYVADANSSRVQQFTASGVFRDAWSTFSSGTDQFHYPMGLAVGGGNLYVTTRLNRVLVFRDPSPSLPPLNLLLTK